MKKTYKFNLPQSKEVEKTNIRVENGEILVDVELKDKFEPKDGDFIYSKGVDSYAIFICKKVTKENALGCFCGIQYFSDNTYTSNCYGSDNYTYIYDSRFATKHEIKKLLSDFEKEYQKKWNAKTKTLEDIYIPKFGDIVRIGTPYKIFKRDYIISIFPNKDIPKNDVSGFFNIAGVNLNGDVWIGGFGGYYNSADIREATESEKQDLFDKLAKAGKRWNAETKELEDIRWRVKKGERYYYVYISDVPIIDWKIEDGDEKDEKRYNSNNYFRTEQAAQPYAEKFKEIFKNSKAE